MANVNCDNLGCIGNVDGHCYAESCRGAIIRISNRRRTPEQAAKFYAIAADMFENWDQWDDLDDNEE